MPVARAMSKSRRRRGHVAALRASVVRLRNDGRAMDRRDEDGGTTSGGSWRQEVFKYLRQGLEVDCGGEQFEVMEEPMPSAENGGGDKGVKGRRTPVELASVALTRG
ncbi:hypothetical protein R3P38DRAFT_2772410 [Favolaschia claudopus]|uniref:Uncharacterized protein n=1 Tax=Favolaschia claudopus TaxID=2862362 RepID=A0AAW0C775_9AGAR